MVFSMKARHEWLQKTLAEIKDDEVIQLEKDLVCIPSYTTEEHRLAEFVGDFLADQGINVEMQEVDLPHNKRSSNQSSNNVIGRIRGSGDGPSLMFNGHMDHGPIGGRNVADYSEWQRDPFNPVVEGDFLYGKGSQDEKGGLCAFLSAGRAIQRVGVRPRGDIVFAAVCGHKTNSVGTKALVDAGIMTDMAINSENARNCIVPLHVGLIKAKVHIFAERHHPRYRKRFSELCEKPTVINQSVKFVSVLGQDCEPHQLESSWLTYQPHPDLSDFPTHRIDGIESYGYQHQAVSIYFRTVPGQTEESVRRDLERVLDNISSKDPNFQARVEMQVHGLAMDTPYDAPIVATLSHFHQQVTGQEPLVGPEGRYGNYGDGSLLSAAGISTCIYGPGGRDLDYSYRVMKGELPPDEQISISQLLVAARVMTLTAVELCC